MQNGASSGNVELGRVLRPLIRSHSERVGRSLRQLSKAIGKHENYLTCYLNASPEGWALPKPPAFGLLLNELGLTQEYLLTEVERRLRERQRATDETFATPKAKP